MDNNEKIQSFAEMVAATERLVRPWRMITIVTNVIWAVIVGLLIWFAYMAPVDIHNDYNQEQDYSEQNMQQRGTIDIVTDGD